MKQKGTRRNHTRNTHKQLIFTYRTLWQVNFFSFKFLDF